jgi:hypothetical protein
VTKNPALEASGTPQVWVACPCTAGGECGVKKPFCLATGGLVPLCPREEYDKTKRLADAVRDTFRLLWAECEV